MNNNEMDWQNIICCPHCGNDVAINKINIKCSSCHIAGKIDNHIIDWSDISKASFIKKNLFKKILNQLNPTSSWLMPFRYISEMQDKKYYLKTLSDHEVAKKWAHQYLECIHLAPGDLILDHGCGKGRVTALANLMGLKAVGQDIQQHDWWVKLEKSNFQVVPSSFSKFPWKNNTFSAVFNIEVIHYIEKEKLFNHLSEIFRVLKPGGYYILLEANSEGYGAHTIKKQIGRLHELETIQKISDKISFKQLSLDYKGFYAPFFALFINFIRNQCSFKHFNPLDFDSKLDFFIPPKKKGLWLMKLQKPICN